MKHFSNETRKKMSVAAKARCTDEWRKKRSDELSTPLDTDAVRNMYESGMTQAEIAECLGVSQKVIWRHMKNHSIKARTPARRNQVGESNHMWKGSAASYKAFHLRVNSERGKAKEYGCSMCGRTDSDVCYDWANLSGNYDDINDYAPMCRSCHRKYDRERKCKNA